jgi:tetratricopeptide (TPR) repeat protein
VYQIDQAIDANHYASLEAQRLATDPGAQALDPVQQEQQLRDISLAMDLAADAQLVHQIGKRVGPCAGRLLPNEIALAESAERDAAKAAMGHFKKQCIEASVSGSERADAMKASMVLRLLGAYDSKLDSLAPHVRAYLAPSLPTEAADQVAQSADFDAELKREGAGTRGEHSWHSARDRDMCSVLSVPALTAAAAAAVAVAGSAAVHLGGSIELRQPPLPQMERDASKRRRTEAAAVPLSVRQATAVQRIARELAELAGAAPNVPQLAECSAQLATLLEQQHQQQQPGAGVPGAAEEDAAMAAVAPFDSLPEIVVELVLLHCDARSLGRMSCASRFFGGGQQRSLVERVASSPARLRAVLTPALRPHEVASRTLQLWRQENPVALSVNVLLQLAKTHAQPPGRRDEALRLYRRVLRAEPGDVAMLKEAAKVLEKQPTGCEEAKALYRRVLVLEPDATDVLFSLANLLSKEPSGREEAEVLFRRVLVLEPGDTDALFNLANLLSKEPSGREEAKALYRRLLVLAPNNSLGPVRFENDVTVLVNLSNLLNDEPGGREEAEALVWRALMLE